ncbi:unnamed protein product, partial [Durusdinium trenchii]
ALCSGRKRWRLVNRDEMSLLRPLYLADLNPVFPMDLEDGQARGVKVYETILEADDLIFVPAGWPHQVDNLETSMAISSNFIVCVLNKLSVDDNRLIESETIARRSRDACKCGRGSRPVVQSAARSSCGGDHATVG